MNFKLTMLLGLLLNLSKVTGQSETTYESKQVISYYENGNVKKIENFLKDSCRLFIDEFQDYLMVDTCHYGYFKEYHTHGILKIIGQYDCEMLKPSLIEDDCFKSGIWYEFDSVGDVKAITRYDRGNPIFCKYALRQDTLTIGEDATWVKLKPYHQINSYLIRCSHQNRSLILEFPVISDHNYWRVYDTPLNLLIYNVDDYPDSNNLLFSFKDDDVDITKNQRYWDVSHLKTGRYYVYYKSLGIPNFCEIEIILEDLPD